MRPRLATSGTCILFILTAGCLSTPAPVDATQDPDTATPIRWPVVALLDTGIHPWHDAFRITTPPPSPPPGDPELVPASLRDRLADEGPAAYNDLEPHRLYWFEGTRVLGISMLTQQPPPGDILEDIQPDPPPIYDGRNHGTSTASMAARAAPHAWILMVQTDELYLDAIRWTAAQPWIDIISISRGNLGHTPSNLTSGPDQYAAAFQQAVDAGKLVVDSAGNFPDPNLLSHSGALWVISVGGSEGDRHGLTPLTSQPADVVANFTAQDLAIRDSDNATLTRKGTSFGAPLVAGVLAEAVHQLRERHGHTGTDTQYGLIQGHDLTLTNRDLRWALNMTASYWTATEWDPTTLDPSNPFGIPYELTTPALPHLEGTPVGPWVQMGWGHVDEALASDIVALLSGDTAPPDKRDASTYMDALFEARSQVWDLYQSRPVVR